MSDTTEILSRLDTLAVSAQSGKPYSYCVTIYADAALAIRELERRCASLHSMLQITVLELNRNAGRISEETLTQAELCLAKTENRPG